MEEFRLADHQFIELARFGLYAEKVAPYMDQLRQVIDMPLPDEPRAKIEAARAKQRAVKELPRWRVALGLDADG